VFPQPPLPTTEMGPLVFILKVEPIINYFGAKVFPPKSVRLVFLLRGGRQFVTVSCLHNRSL